MIRWLDKEAARRSVSRSAVIEEFLSARMRPEKG
jgi:hypothetical protein